MQLPVTMGGFILSVLISVMLMSGCDADHVRDSDSPVTCSTAGVECDYNSTNLLDTVTHVYTLKECRQLCLDDRACEFISYYDDSASPVSHVCQLLKSCGSVTQNANCISENMQCLETCGSNMVGDLDENILIMTPDVDTEVTCKQMCVQNDGCSFYTYYFESDPYFHNYCFLLSEFVHPSTECDHCKTGPPDCTNPCTLQLNGEFYQSLMLTNTSETQYITVNGVASCELRFLAVGGGGKYTATGGGAGSGYLQYRTINVNPGTVISLDVGDQAEPSTVAIVNGDTFTAQPGEDNQFPNGGAGYCGGGGTD